MDERPDGNRQDMSQLRQAAEAETRSAGRTVLEAASPSRETAALLHELEVQRIELETQSESLRQSRSALEESRDRYSRLFDFAPLGYIMLGDAGVIAAVNLAAAALLGTERSQLISRRFQDFVTGEDRERWQHLLQNACNTPPPHAEELQLQRADGSPFAASIDCRHATIADGSGELLLALTDITERKQSETQRLAEARQQRDALVRGVHHRIKNNLQSVASLLQRELGQFVDQNPRLATAISQVHAIAEVHGLQSADAEEAIRLSDSVRNICKVVSDLSQRPLLLGIGAEQAACETIRIESKEAVPVALVLNELILNAVKHSPAGSRDPTVSLRADGSGAQILLRNAVTGAPRFDFASGAGLGAGLRLVRSLLPQRGAQLSHELDAEGFMLTSLKLAAPVVAMGRVKTPG